MHLFTFPLIKNSLCHIPPIISPLKSLAVLIALYYVPIQRLCLIIEPTCIPWLCHFYSKGYYCLDHLPIIFKPHSVSSLIRNLFTSSLLLSHPLHLYSRFHFNKVFGYLTIERTSLYYYPHHTIKFVLMLLNRSQSHWPLLLFEKQ